MTRPSKGFSTARFDALEQHVRHDDPLVLRGFICAYGVVVFTINTMTSSDLITPRDYSLMEI